MFSGYSFLKLLITIPVAPIITGTIVHFRFHIRCISVHKLIYFNFFSASFCTTFLSAGIATSISVQIFSFLFLIIISGLFAVTSLSVCTAWFHLLLLLLLLIYTCLQYHRRYCDQAKVLDDRGFDSWREQGNSLFSEMSIQALGPPRSPIQWMLEDHSLTLKLTPYFQLGLMLRMNGAGPPRPNSRHVMYRKNFTSYCPISN